MNVERSQNIYDLPVPRERITMVVIKNTSHQGPFEGAVDMAVPINTPVHASLDGTVTHVKDDGDRYGNDPKYGPDVNFIAIKHANGEYSEYLHLGKSTVDVQPGDAVTTGQLIGRTGLSGWMTEPHIHWTVFRRIPDEPGFKCLEISTAEPLEEMR